MTLSRALARLADAWGVAVSYRGYDGTRRRVSPDALVGVLRALGAPIERPDDASEALRARVAQQRAAVLDPVTVAWDGTGPVVVRTPASHADGEVSFELTLDDGTTMPLDGASCAPEPVDPTEQDGTTVVRRFSFPDSIPYGAHRLRCRAAGREAEATLLSAPRRAYQFPSARAWGVFAPVYALRTHAGDALPGDLDDLSALADWAGDLGAAVVGTLPLLAAFLDEPYEASPYSPVSRRFWNELYAATGAPVAATGDDGLIDLRAAYVQRRRALEGAAARGEQADLVRAYASRCPGVERYARFRAAVEQYGSDWSSWPARWRIDGIPDDAVDHRRVHYHRLAQAVVDDQLGALAARLRTRSQALYLDFPLGTHRHGFDVWDEPGLFVDDASVGAPPDQFFTHGQDWGFPPVHPESSRGDGHRYFADCIEAHLTHAGLLRVDHVIGLHRLWWIPPGHDPSDGAFVRYRNDELYARLCLASIKHRAALIGENLGTVPPEVNRELRRHRIGGMHIVQFELDADEPGAVRPPARGALTSLDTHDTATFAGFWTGAAIDDRVALGVTSPEEAERERDQITKLRARVRSALRDADLLQGGQRDDTRAVMAALLEVVGTSEAQIVLVAIEDLWLELKAQNVPGTVTPQNWRRPAAFALDELDDMTEIVEVLRRLAAARTRSVPKVTGRRGSSRSPTRPRTRAVTAAEGRS